MDCPDRRNVSVDVVGAPGLSTSVPTLPRGPFTDNTTTNNNNQSTFSRCLSHNLPNSPSPPRDPTLLSGHSATLRSFSDQSLRQRPSSADPANVINSTDVTCGQRSYVGVLRRLSSMLSSANPAVDSDSVRVPGAMSALGRLRLDKRRGHWLPDSVSKQCYDCGEKFTAFRRRHHCRVCGQIFCSRCCGHMLAGRDLGCVGQLRVCTYCCRIALAHMQSAADTNEINPGVGSQYGVARSFDVRAVLESISAQLDSAHQLSSACVGSGRQRRVSGSSLHLTTATTTTSPVLATSASISSMAANSTDRFVNAADAEIQDLTYLATLLRMICEPIHGVGLRRHRHRLKSFNACLIGSEVVDWMVQQRRCDTRSQAVAIGQRLLNVGLLVCVSGSGSATGGGSGSVNMGAVFRDEYSLYRPTGLADRYRVDSAVSRNVLDRGMSYDEEDAAVMSAEPQWLSQIEFKEDEEGCLSVDLFSDISPCTDMASGSDIMTEGHGSSYDVQLNLDMSCVSMSRNIGEGDAGPTMTDGVIDKLSHTVSSTVSIGTVVDESIIKPPPEFLEDESSDGLASPARNAVIDQRWSSAFESIESTLLTNLLESAGLPAKWFEPLLEISRAVCRLVKPDVRGEGDLADIIRYVRVKRVPGGRVTDCRIVNGVVFSQCPDHAEMRCDITNPQILLINCPIAYERYEGRITSLEPLVMQQSEVLRHIVELLLSLAPDVVVVERHVECQARDMLLQAGVTLLSNAKRRVMADIARCTQASVMSCVDVQITKPALGICHQFYTRQYTMEGGHKKTLVFFDGCASHLGCTVLLRGGHMGQLRRAKRVLRMMVRAQYGWHLVRSYLRASSAISPALTLVASDVREEENSDGKESERKLEGNESFTDVVAIDCGAQSNSGVEGSQIVLAATSSANERTRLDSNSSTTRLTSKEVTDKSDPLQCESESEQSTNDETQHQQKKQQKKLRYLSGSSDKTVNITLAHHTSLKDALVNIIICATPCLRITAPYLETEKGRLSSLRRFFPSILYWSAELDPLAKARMAVIRKTPIASAPKDADVDRKHLHRLFSSDFARLALDDKRGQNSYDALIADFRARGCSRKAKLSSDAAAESVHTQQSKYNNPQPDVWPQPNDCLSPFNHQRLPMQVDTYCRQANGHSIRCSEPRLVCVEFESAQDVSLGAQLEAECFSSDFDCGRRLCQSPASWHVRRHLHGSGCLLRRHLQLPSPGCPDGRLWMWTRCMRCGDTSAARPIDDDTWTLSFSRFVELFMLCDRRVSVASNSGCNHSLFAERQHCFASGCRVALFEYIDVQMNDVVLPPTELVIDLPSFVCQRVTDELRTVSEGIHVFGSVMERLFELESAAVTNSTTNSNGINTPSGDDDCVTAVRTALEDVQREKVSFRSLLTGIEDLVRLLVDAASSVSSDIDVEIDEESVFLVMDRSVIARRVIADSARKWSQRLSELWRMVKAAPRSRIDDANSATTVELKMANTDTDPSIQAANDSVTVTDAVTDVSVDDIVKSAVSKSRMSTSSVAMAAAERIKALKSLAFSGNEFSDTIVAPIRANDHFQLPPTDPPTFVSGDDLGSIIAYCLLSPDYAAKVVSSSPLPPHLTDDRPNHSSVESEPTDSAALLSGKQLAQLHIDVNLSADGANFYCKILMAAQFRRLRSALFADDNFEQRLVRSLSQCRPWKARGGKSGSTFQKSLDDRFIIKTISRIEKDHFVRFAANYVDYVLMRRSQGRPSALAKIVGVFLVGYRNNTTGSARKAYTIVMENLFYGRQLCQKFDLKGSLRNRMADTKEPSEVVLMDQNVLTGLGESPLYVRSHAKRVLMCALASDTQFLQRCQVMDYSLLAGVDRENDSLVVGIIDYLRSYTYDKAMETYIKSYNVFLGDSENRPTVLDPVRYRARFLGMMNKYFTDVPDRWLGFEQRIELLE